MAYDRYDPQRGGREDERGWRGERDGRRKFEGRSGRYEGSGGGGRHDGRGFFERAGEQISSWFGDDHDDHRDHHRGHHDDHHEARGVRERWSEPRGDRWSGQDRGGERDRDRSQQRGFGQFGGGSAEREPYRPFAGDYGRSSDSYRGGSEEHSPYRNPYPQDRARDHHDRHYHDWRERQMSELDRDYEDYRRENQSRFEQEFTSWREQRQQKRNQLRNIREHMEVVGSDDQHVGTVDKVAGDRVILTKSDPAAGGVHHSLSCTEIARVEGERVILDVSAEQAKQRWRDEDRGRALFERQDQGEAGPRILDESFGGTYR